MEYDFKFSSFIEYKYVVVTNNDFNRPLWEQGNNRLINSIQQKKDQLFLGNNFFLIF